MTYLALARKWRPRTFEDVVGQPHIVRALSNALTSGRVHHAFLFAGTRGVGKTTVARILARCLNCETGVTATPCGTCRACIAIEEGRFVDLIEVDAASRTGIDDIRELLDNVQYMPAAGRYKVYLVDEVHMLSKPAFNALLKTLEEPPPHVKFLFATTDPQRLPVTVLSRCLQFNLKRLSTTLIAGRMSRICDEEGIKAEAGALARLARAASGSMRDGLSLLDQALAFGNDTLQENDVAEMLGSLDLSRVVSLIQYLARGNASELIAHVRQLEELVPDYAGLLDDLATSLQQIAVIQIAGKEAIDDDQPAELVALAETLDAETTQLYYQVAVTSRRDLPLAPDPRIGFEMAMLRMLAFAPIHPLDGPAARNVAAAPPRPIIPTPAPPASAPAAAEPATIRNAGDWTALLQALGLEGAVKQLAVHTQFVSCSPFELRLSVEPGNAHLMTDQLKGRLATAVQSRIDTKLKVIYEIRDAVGQTIAAREDRVRDEALRKARQAIESDPNVRDLASVFGGAVVPESIKPIAAGDDRSPSPGTRRAGKPRQEPRNEG